MEFRILGPLEVIDGGRPLALAGRKQRALLAVMLLHANEVLSTDRLLDELWGDQQPVAGSTALRVRVSQLRKALGSKETLITRPPGYMLRVEPEQVDLRRFERLVAEAHGAEPTIAGAKLREALALWRGSPLEDLAYEPFAQAAIARLQELRLLALERRIEADLALGRHADLVAELRPLVHEHPLRERLRAHLMLALYRTGRQGEALEEYRAARRTLVEELGIEPSPALRELERALLRQDPALALEPAAAPARAILVAPADDGGLDTLLALAIPLARRPVRDVIIAQAVPAGELARAGHLLARHRKHLQAEGFTARVAAFTSAAPGRDIVRLVSEQDVDLVLLAGTLDADEGVVLAHAPCDVGVLLGAEKASSIGPQRPILVPFGGADHDWAAVELATWLAQAQDAPLRLAGVAGGRRGRDASRQLASASLIVQRIAEIEVVGVLIEATEDGLIRAAEDAGLIVFGLSAGWRQKGTGEVRTAIARRAAVPTLVVRKGIRPSGLVHESSLTRFTWSLGRQR